MHTLYKEGLIRPPADTDSDCKKNRVEEELLSFLDASNNSEAITSGEKTPPQKNHHIERGNRNSCDSTNTAMANNPSKPKEKLTCSERRATKKNKKGKNSSSNSPLAQVVVDYDEFNVFEDDVVSVVTFPDTMLPSQLKRECVAIDDDECTKQVVEKPLEIGRAHV